jgi:hypothetical protein
LTGDVALRDDRAYKGLTAQQWSYCEARAAGSSVVEAYREVYQPTNENPMRVYQHAGAVEGNPLVQARLREMLLAKQGEATLVPQIGKEFVLNGIAAEAINAPRPADRLRAYEMLGKTMGLFTPEREDEAVPRSVEEIDARLKARLAAALAPAIEETARDVTPRPAGVDDPGDEADDEPS